MQELQKLKLPEYEFKFRTFEQSKQIFDLIRKKFVSLTPEEWVRQNLMMYFIEDLNYPASCMGIEQGMNLYKTSKRTDIIIYCNDGEPWMLVECKAPSVKIDQSTLDQVGRYNIVHKAPYLFISNGLTHYMLKRENDSYISIDKAPAYKAALKS